MLLDFMQEHKSAILAATSKRLFSRTPELQTFTELEGGLDTFYRHLLVLAEWRGEKRKHGGESDDYAKFLSDHGYLIEQIVITYGAICEATNDQAIQRGIELKPADHKLLNSCLDEACAEAVQTFTEHREASAQKAERVRLGSLAHELRNALSGAITAFQVLKRGELAIGSSTGDVLKRNLLRMSDLIDRSLSEVRLVSQESLKMEEVSVINVFRDIEGMAAVEAQMKNISVRAEIPAAIKVEVDQHLFVSAFSNLVKNAIKYTHENGVVGIRAHSLDSKVVIEVEDECGGLPPEKAEELFTPFVQTGYNRTGTGLGLSIAQRAIDSINGKIWARNNAPKGCVFVIELPNATKQEPRHG